MSRSRPSPLAGSTEGASAALLHDSVDPTFTSPRGRGSIDRDAGGQAYVRANAASLQAGSDAYAYAALNAIPDQRFVQSQILTPPHTVNNYSRYAYDPSTANGTPIDKQLLSPHESLNDIAFLSPIATTQSPMAVAAHPAERSNIDAQGRPVLKTPSKHPRLLSLDAFRGLTISWMIMADEFGSIWSSKLDHSPWNEIRFADFVFPAFVFIVGLAVPMSLRNASSTMQSRLAATKRVTWRSVKMFFIGFYVDGGNFPTSWNVASMRVPGILQRLAACYFFASLTHIWVPTRQRSAEEEADREFEEQEEEGEGRRRKGGWRCNGENPFRIYNKYAYQLLVAVVLMVSYILVTFLTKVPIEGCERGSLYPGCSAAKYWDEQIFGASHMYATPTYNRSEWCSTISPQPCPDACPIVQPAWCNEPFDPEGALSGVAAIVSCVIGLFFGHILEEEKRHKQRLQQWCSFSLVSLVVGLIIHFNWMPMNKNLWSASFVFTMAGVDGFVMSIFYYLIDVKGHKKIVYPMICMGMNAILVYLLAESSASLDTWLGAIYFGNDPNKNFIHFLQVTTTQAWFGFDWGTFAYTMGKLGGWYAISTVLARMNIFWKI